MTLTPRAATVIVSSDSALIFTLDRQEFQHFVISSGLRSNQMTIINASLPKAPDLPMDYITVPKTPPFHPNCVVLLPPPELNRAPPSTPGDAGISSDARQRARAAVPSTTLLPFRGLLLQPWPDALNDSVIDVLGACPLPSILSCALKIFESVFLFLPPPLPLLFFEMQFRTSIPALPKKFHRKL